MKIHFSPDPKPLPTPKKKKKAIPKMSKKRKMEQAIYDVRRPIFLKKNPYCFIKGCGKKSDTIEHSEGRWGDNFLDESKWRACCWKHNTELENNSELSKEYQTSKIHGGEKLIKKS